MMEKKERKEAILKAASLDPPDALVAITKGLSSFDSGLRDLSRRALGEVKAKLSDGLAATHDKETYRELMAQSDAFCAKIYLEMAAGDLESNFYLYFRTLLESKGMGPYYAWKILCMEHLCPRNFLSVLDTLSDREKLSLLLRYIDASPSVRRGKAVVCKKLIAGIESSHAVIELFAALFDKGREPDPILYTLPFLKNPERLLYEDLYSPDPQKRDFALKAASYILEKLDPSFLGNILRTEKDKTIRITALKIIENSTTGTYASIWSDILQLVYTGSREEALSAFRAIVVADDKDLPGLIESIHLNRPEILNDILEEIAGFSRIAFFFIQDIAFNRKKYSRIHIGVHRACILGIAEKRPERVLNVLKGFRHHSDVDLRMNVNSFYDKVGRYLAGEREEIKTAPETPPADVHSAGRKKMNLLKTLLSPTVEKRVSDLREAELGSRYDFDRENIEAVDLSGIYPAGAAIFFTGCRIKDSDFSQAKMIGACFDNSVFFEVNLKNASLEEVSFENCVLVNIDAAGSSMVRCNFRNARIHNCDFSSADVTDSFFTGASITKTSFVNSDITGASFVRSELSLVSFKDSWTEFSDFTAVCARFSRFTSFTDILLKTEYADFNARSFQLALSDIPALDERVVSSIEMLIFIEFIHYGRKMFFKKNKLSHLIALDVFVPKQADLFEIMPLLLHENINIPGYGTIEENCPKGIAEYLPELQTGRVAEKYLDKSAVLLRRNPGAFIEGFFTIGSTGSIAQSKDSDIDYWICIREEFFSAKQKTLFQKKLDLLARWAENKFGVEVNFFIVDVNKALHNEFGELTFESSGSAQARILKEEFYRTMIWVAGKIPLWCVLPVTVSKNYYSRINSLVKASFPNSRYINLGDLHGISPGEYFGASVWQMYKLLNSPFKSVIKMGLLVKFINEYGRDPLLCNRAKNLWMKAGTHMMIYRSDPYYTLLRNLMDYYRDQGDRESTELIQVCFFLKMKFQKESDIQNTLFGLRGILVERCRKNWGMKMEDVLDIGRFQNWDYKRTVELSSKIKRYMIGKTRAINKSFRNSFQKHSSITPEERTALVRKIVVEFGLKKGKIEKTLLLSRKDRHFQRLSLEYTGPNQAGSSWSLISKSSGSGYGAEEPLKTADRIETIVAWLVNNSFAADDTIINLVPNTTYVTIDDVNNLLVRMNKFFQPVLQQPVHFSTLLDNPAIVAAFVSVNLYAPPKEQSFQHYCVVWVTSWGEMFTESVETKGNGFTCAGDVRQSLCSMLDIHRLPENTYWYLPKSFSGKIDI